MSITITVPEQESRMSTGYELEDQLRKVDDQIDVLEEEIEKIDDIKMALKEYDTEITKNVLRDEQLLGGLLGVELYELEIGRRGFLNHLSGFRNDLETQLRELKEKVIDLEEKIEVENAEETEEDVTEELHELWTSEDNNLWDSQDNNWSTENRVWSV